MKILFVDLRSKSVNSAIMDGFGKNRLLSHSFRGKVWSHCLVEESFSNAGVCRKDDISYANFMADKRLPSGYDLYVFGSRGMPHADLEKRAAFDGEKLVRLVRSMLGGKRMLGLCYGHQAIGVAAGMDISMLATRRKGIGTVDFMGTDSSVIYNHTRSLSNPRRPGTEVIWKDGCVDAVFLDGKARSAGFQFHPEYAASEIGFETYLARNDSISWCRDEFESRYSELSQSAIHIIQETFEYLFQK